MSKWNKLKACIDWGKQKYTNIGMFDDQQNSQGQQFQTAEDNVEYLNFNKSGEMDRLLSTRQQFRKTVKQNVQLKFQKITHFSNNSHKYHKSHHKNACNNISFQSQPSLDVNGRRQSEDSNNEDGFSSLGCYYENHQHAELIYKKTRNLGTSWIGQREYYTSLFASPESIQKSKSKCLFGKFKDSQTVQQQIAQFPSSQPSKITPPIEFDSDFQSGNLYAVYKVGILQYDLLLQNDINTKGNTQWFYFRIKNLPPNKSIKLNIVNFRKSDSLFNYGMLPCVHSLQNEKKNGQSWVKKGQKVKYLKNSHNIEVSRKFYYTLTFTISTQFPNDILKVAQCYPYTANDLNNYIEEIQKVNYKRNWCQRVTVMPKTLGGNKIESLVIKEHNPKFRSHEMRPLIFLLARQHPGQTPGSFMIEGLIEYLLSKDKDSEYLRKNYQIRAIPMANPDGVQAGNYRTNLYGVDLNRRWDCSTKQRQPIKSEKQSSIQASQIVYIKRYISTHAKNRQIAYVLDFHGHSRKLYSFFYGNSFPQSPSDVKIFPYICSKLTSMIRYEDCTFNIEQDKRCTARIQLLANLKISNIYTFQASFFGYISKNKQKKPFTIQSYKNLGMIIGKAIYICQKRKQQSQVEGKQKILYEKWFRELTSNNSLIKVGQNEDSGSESSPDEWEIMEMEKQLLEQQFLNQKQSKRKVSHQKLARQKFRHQGLSSAKQPLKSLRHMQVLNIARVNSVFPNDVLALVPNTFYLKIIEKPKKVTKNIEVQTDPCPIIKVYETCKVSEIELGDLGDNFQEEKSAVFERTKARSIGDVMQSSSTIQNSSFSTKNAIKNFSSIVVARSKSIHEKQLFQNAKHLSALKKSTEIRKHFKKVLTEHQLSKPKSQLFKNNSIIPSKKTSRHVQTVISFHKENILKHDSFLTQNPAKVEKTEDQLIHGIQGGDLERQKMTESKFFFQTPEKPQKQASKNDSIQTSSKYWTVDARRKSLGSQTRQLIAPTSRNQFRKTTIMTKGIFRSNSNNYYNCQKIDRNQKLVQNWKIKKKSLI